MNEPRNRGGTGASWRDVVDVSGANPAENYERFFVPAIGAPVAADLIEIAALRPGERVLDVACGTGVVTRLAAARVGNSGSIVGLDVNPGMLAVARSVTRSPMVIEWRKLPRQADSSKGDWPAAECLGRNVSGGTRPRLSWGRSPL